MKGVSQFQHSYSTIQFYFITADSPVTGQIILDIILFQSTITWINNIKNKILHLEYFIKKQILFPGVCFVNNKISW